MKGDQLSDWRAGLYVLSVACLAVIAVADGWRTASLAGMAVGAILLTRTRFALPWAAALSLLAALLIMTGPAVSA